MQKKKYIVCIGALKCYFALQKNWVNNLLFELVAIECF